MARRCAPPLLRQMVPGIRPVAQQQVGHGLDIAGFGSSQTVHIHSFKVQPPAARRATPRRARRRQPAPRPGVPAHSPPGQPDRIIIGGRIAFAAIAENRHQRPLLAGATICRAATRAPIRWFRWSCRPAAPGAGQVMHGRQRPGVRHLDHRVDHFRQEGRLDPRPADALDPRTAIQGQATVAADIGVEEHRTLGVGAEHLLKRCTKTPGNWDKTRHGRRMNG